MSLNSEAWPRPDCVPIVSRRLSSARVVVPCFRCPALNKLARDQYLYFSYYLQIINLLQLIFMINCRAKSHVFSWDLTWIPFCNTLTHRYLTKYRHANLFRN